MNSNISGKKWLDDFQGFVESSGEPVSESLSVKIRERIRTLMTPPPWFVFAKLLGIHIVVGTFSLAICDQFEMSPFRTGFSLSQYVMKFGDSVCMAFCGFLFVGLSITFGKLILIPEEFAVLRKNSFLQTFGLAMFSLGVFFALGAELLLPLVVFWVIGAEVGGVLATLIPKSSLNSHSHAR